MTGHSTPNWRRPALRKHPMLHSLLARRRCFTALLALLLSLLSIDLAYAVIQVLIPLQQLIDKDADLIFVAKVERLDPEKPAVVLTVTEKLKGPMEFPFERLPVNLTGDKELHTPKLLKRLALDLPIVVFVKKEPQSKFMALAFSNGTWFQLLGQTEKDSTRWAFTHCEPYLRRTFKGTTAELQEVVTGVLKKKQKAPPPDKTAQPGLGPEIESP